MGLTNVICSRIPNLHLQAKDLSLHFFTLLFEGFSVHVILQPATLFHIRFLQKPSKFLHETFATNFSSKKYQHTLVAIVIHLLLLKVDEFHSIFYTTYLLQFAKSTAKSRCPTSFSTCGACSIRSGKEKPEIYAGVHEGRRAPYLALRIS